MRGEFVKVPWKKLMCNNRSTPRWLFILNLAIQRRLSTKDRLTKWGIIVDQTCILCSKEQECLDHLFFECEFSKELWYRLLQWQGIHRAVMIWQDEIDWASRELRSNNPSADIFRMSLTGCVYYIWQERNLRIFQHKQRSLDVILRSLVQDMFCRGCGKSKLGKKLNTLDFYP